MKKTLAKIDQEVIWHPFTQMADWSNSVPSEPLVIAKGKGNYLYDINGKKYLDGVSSLWVTVHGHKKREINNAIKAQINKIAHSTFLGLTHEPAITLAKKLVEITPEGLTRVFYSDNGSTSVEIALKMTYQYWQQKGIKSKNMFLSLTNAYHGDTIGSVSVGGMDLFHSKFRHLLFKTHFVQSPYCYRCKSRYRLPVTGYRSPTKNFKKHCGKMGCAGECIKEVEQTLKKYNKTIAAAVIEPMIQGAAGMLRMPPGYLKEFERLCKKYNVLLICDEVATGFGRTGKMFACEHENILPDFMCIAKGITGGYLPLAVTLSSEKIYKAFLGKYEEFKTFFHGHTYTANPLGCAAAIANLELFKKERIIPKLKDKIVLLKNELSKLEKIPYIGEIRQIGLMVGIEIVRDKKTKEIFSVKDKIVMKICDVTRKYGLIIRPLGNVIVLMPPLSIKPTEIKRIIKILKKAIKEITVKA